MHRLRKPWPALIFWLGSALLLIVLIGPRVGRSAFHPDETGWIASGRAAFRLVQAGELRAPFWQSNKILGRKNPWLGRTLFGAAVVSAGYRNARLKPYDFALSQEENRALGALPPPGMLRAARLVSAALGVLACLAVLGIGTLLASRLEGLAAALLLALNPVFAQAAGQAMVDVPALAFGLLGIATALVARQRLLAGRQVLWQTGLAGIALGAGMACKLNAGLSLCAALALLCAPLLARGARPGLRRQLVWAAGLTLLSCAGAMVAFNPSLYGDPAGGLEAMLSFNQLIHHEHAGTAAYLSNPLVRLRYCLDSLQRDPLLMLLGPAGLLCLLAGGLYRLRKVDRTALNAISLWLLVTLAGLALWLPLPEPRYLLPLAPGIALLEALLVKQTLLSLWLFAQPAQRQRRASLSPGGEKPGAR